MKKILFLFLALPLMASKCCNQCCDDSTSTDRSLPAPNQLGCVKIESYRTSDDYMTRAKWLSDNQDNFCDVSAVYAASLDSHMVNPNDFKPINGARSLPKSWEEIRTLIKAYNLYGSYLKFTVDEQAVSAVERVDSYPENGFAFSVAFFQAVKRSSPSGKPNFKFTPIHISDAGKEKLAILVEVSEPGQTTVTSKLFDYSKEPKDVHGGMLIKNPM